jgi:hypothetical protein
VVLGNPKLERTAEYGVLPVVWLDQIPGTRGRRIMEPSRITFHLLDRRIGAIGLFQHGMQIFTISAANFGGDRVVAQTIGHECNISTKLSLVTLIFGTPVFRE